MNYTNGEWKPYKTATGWSVYADGDEVSEVYSCHTGLAEANAQLIASAPDLYEACKELEPYFTWLEENKLIRITSLFKQALAKAEGK